MFFNMSLLPNDGEICMIQLETMYNYEGQVNQDVAIGKYTADGGFVPYGVSCCYGCETEFKGKIVGWVTVDSLFK